MYITYNTLTMRCTGEVFLSDLDTNDTDIAYLFVNKVPSNLHMYSVKDGVLIKDTLLLTPAEIKQVKVNAIGTLVVTTTSGRVFDGNEVAQDRMVRAIQIAAITSQVETSWKLADNTIVMVTLDELKEALALAGQEMSRIWLEQ